MSKLLEVQNKISGDFGAIMLPSRRLIREHMFCASVHLYICDDRRRNLTQAINWTARWSKHSQSLLVLRHIALDYSILRVSRSELDFVCIQTSLTALPSVAGHFELAKASVGEYRDKKTIGSPSISIPSWPS